MYKNMSNVLESLLIILTNSVVLINVGQGLYSQRF